MSSSQGHNGNKTTSPTANIKPNRLPAPTLFVGPPSQNASRVSISRSGTVEAALNPERRPLARQRSSVQGKTDGAGSATATGLAYQDSFGEADGERPVTHGFNAANEHRMGARWQEMQRTLNEIELTAQRSTNVFGAGHARALDDLRHAQIELARAWGRGSEDHGAMDVSSANGDGGSTLDDDQSGDSEVHRFRAAAASTASDRGNANVAGRQRAGTVDTVASASTALSGESESDGPSNAQKGVGGGSSSPPERGYLEDETARDIKRASARRAANEAYFRKVESSVQDVVAKLEGVAAAMRAVESENRSLWSDSESTQTDQ